MKRKLTKEQLQSFRDYLLDDSDFDKYEVRDILHDLNAADEEIAELKKEVQELANEIDSMYDRGYQDGRQEGYEDCRRDCFDD